MIKNYSSQVPANRSVLKIEEKLVQHGAKNILKLYDNQKLSGIAFIIPINGKEYPFRLPAKINRVEKQLLKQIKRPRNSTTQKISDQAERTAWKLLSEWVEIQISLIELDQVELLEVFMPYLYDSNKNQTFFEKMKNNNFSMLEDKRIY